MISDKASQVLAWAREHAYMSRGAWCVRWAWRDVHAICGPDFSADIVPALAELHDAGLIMYRDEGPGTYNHTTTVVTAAGCDWPLTAEARVIAAEPRRFAPAPPQAVTGDLFDDQLDLFG
jgi:hypothetical protein